ncbi:MAG: hypothetical protein ABFS46_14305 [Myxococcota bacterium]
MKKEQKVASGLHWRRFAGWTLLVLLASVLPSQADTDPCREWRDEHSDWMTRVVRGYLTGAPREALDLALFELLRREAYLTSCEISPRQAREHLVGWRLVDRTPDEYGGAVLESLLVRAGLPTELRDHFAAELGPTSFAVERRGARAPHAAD